MNVDAPGPVSVMAQAVDSRSSSAATTASPRRPSSGAIWRRPVGGLEAGRWPERAAGRW
ncbi:hypothetical protein ABT168_00895 [Streptomyces sp. NPDC001793]|uniref:hypothetical protein n=1 Tax=Streptomyces sp. NPDC001793 TaxID=3154657 RepID=UPI0033167EBC